MSTQIGIFLYPGFTQLDAMGPFEVFSRIPGASVHLIAKGTEPVKADTGLSVLPTTSQKDCPSLDIFCVPGGKGMVDLLEDEETLAFLRSAGQNARYVTAVCTGSILLGAAGLMKGYKATTHWAWTEKLQHFGAIYTEGRVVRDQNRITGGGVTAGIDFALTVAAEIAGESVAQAIQLGLEYAPDPPFDAGSPKTAPSHLVDMVRELAAPRVDRIP